MILSTTYYYRLDGLYSLQRTFDIANIQIEFVKSKSFFNFFFDKFSYQKPCQSFVAMGRVELPYGPYERPVLPLDYIAIAFLEQRIGIEPTSSAWQADILTVVLTLHFYHSQPDHFFNKDLMSSVIGILLSFLCLSLLAFFLDECLLWASVFIQGSGSSPYESPIFYLI